MKHMNFALRAAVASFAMAALTTSVAFAQDPTPNTDAPATAPSATNDGLVPPNNDISGVQPVAPNPAADTVVAPSTAPAVAPYTAPAMAGTDNSAGALHAKAPVIADPNRPGFFEAGIGPAFALGMNTDQPLIDITGAYLYNFNPQIAGKVLADMNFGGGTDTSRWITLGVGADYYLQQIRPSYGIPYVMGDLGLGFTRNSANREDDAPAIGAGAGFKFAADEVNFDVNLHYQVLTAQVDNRTPSIVGLRAAVNF